jgi:predicted transposase/invertase (TIGR01784 family)
MANEYDKVLRESIKEPKHNLLKQLLGVDAVHIRAVPQKVRQTIVEREADTVLEVETIKGDKFIVHIEWQSTNDSRMHLRMARYDLLLMESYHYDVMGVVVYVGNEKLTMKDGFKSFGSQYTYILKDIREFAPEVFLSSNDPGELVLAILAGWKDGKTVIQEILRKLRILTRGDNVAFKEKVKHLELIAQLRGKSLQEQIIKEEENMPITIDIRKDLRFQQGMREGIEAGKKEGIQETRLQTARKMLEEGISVALVQKIMGLDVVELNELTGGNKD